MTTQLTLTQPARLAEQAKAGLRMVGEGETRTMAGWLVYGKALNKGRKLFPSDNKFHDWMVVEQLVTPCRPERSAAMWAAADIDDAFTATRKANPRVRTVRGLHAKWKDAQKPQAKPKLEIPTEDELRVVRKLQDLINHPSTSDNQRDAAQRKLDTYNERFGKIEPETQQQKLSKKELAHKLADLVVLKAAKNKKAREVIEYALEFAYGNIEGNLESLLKSLSK